MNISSHPFISASCIVAPIHQYFRLATECNSAAATTFTQLEHYSTVFSSFDPSCIILTLILQYHRSSQYFSLCSSVVSSLASFLLFISPQFTIPPSPTLVHTLCKTIPICFTCTSKEPPVKVIKREREKEKREIKTKKEPKRYTLSEKIEHLPKRYYSTGIQLK